MKKKIVAALTLAVVLCGCSHKTEVRDKGFVKTIGCDEDGFSTVAIKLYGGDETFKGTGETFYTAIENAETSQGKTFFTGHLEMLVLTKGDITKQLSSMIKNNRISPSCAVIMAEDSGVKAVENSSENTLSDILGNSCRKGYISKKNISDVLNELLEKDKKAAVPVITKEGLLMGIIDENSVIGVLSEEESKGLCFLTDSIRDVYLPVEIEGEAASFHIDKSDCRIDGELHGNTIKITVEIKITGSCTEEGVSSDDIKAAAAEKISSLCSKAISKTVIGLKADVLGIMKTLRAKNIETDKSLEQLISRLNFAYTIKIGS